MQKPAPDPPRAQTPAYAREERHRPLGADLLERASPQQLPDRAKAVAVMRRAREVMEYCEPDVHDELRLQGVVDVAARDVGLRPGEYRAIVRKDPELAELERTFLEGVRATVRR